MIPDVFLISSMLIAFFTTCDLDKHAGFYLLAVELIVIAIMLTRSRK